MTETNEKMYVYCHTCEKLLFVGEQKAAVSFSTCLSMHKQVEHYGHKHTTGKLWYFNKWNPEIDTKGWDNYGTR